MTGSNTEAATEQSAKIYVTGKSSNGRGIFVADLQNLAFIKIPSSLNPRRISYDSKEMKIYWTDPSDKLVYRADMNGTNREEVITPDDNDRSLYVKNILYFFNNGIFFKKNVFIDIHYTGKVTSITIAEQSRTLYIAHKHQRKVTSVSIDNVEGNGPFPRNQTDFVTDLSSKPTSLEVDETEGFLYLAMGRFIKRKSLNGDNDVEDVYGSSSRITGISIDASRNPPRIFFCDYKEDNISRSFYMDTATPFKGVNVTELTTHLHDLELRPEKWTDVAYFKGSIYWTSRDPTGIAVMNNYDQDDPSCNITVPGFRKLNRLLIIDNQKSWPGSWPTGSNNGQTSLSQSYAYEGDSTNSSSSDD
ncbi:uncharacterized protein LOC121409387 [Lytechinus variegatus]|uniref:uncharacterized protein LOC121409387 n=1 Tax=Lytechinus variegatus TaxID=7654 RepID=UPI001BB2B9D4|nr:uncharacterized protein LOC121409387 [Lytechinus variegatus]